jgi:hypothetical protein
LGIDHSPLFSLRKNSRQESSDRLRLLFGQPDDERCELPFSVAFFMDNKLY